MNWKGPTNNIWGEDQCKKILGRELSSKDQLTDCKLLCQKTKTCTAVNYKHKARCILRACPLPVPTPKAEGKAFKGHYLS